MLSRLIYASHAARLIEVADIRDILFASRPWNVQHGITGMLCYGNARFLQYIEGEREEINALYALIMSDKRHKSLVLLDYGPVPSRLFDDWSMGFISLAEEDDMKRVKQASSIGDFRPETLQSGQVVALIGDLKLFLHPQASQAAGPAVCDAMSLIH